jgi:pyrroloquinoline quinone biosynthesis protein B
MLRVVVLGAAAGGGVPQWNCGCPVCRAARNGHSELRRTQASIAFSADGSHWFLVNASPDLRQQLITTPQLHPAAGQLRHSPIAGVILTNGEVDAVAGLLSMREGSPFTLYAHPKVLAILKSNSIFHVLDEKKVQRQPIEMDQAFEPALPDGMASGIEVLPFAVPGKSAWYLEGRAHPAGNDGDGDTLGLRITDKASGKQLYFLAACAGVNDELRSRLRGAIESLAKLDIGRKMFLHINNSNPVLLRDSAERRTAEGAGWQIPADGTEITL